MRDHMHPPRMSAPSCIVPPTEHLVIQPHIVPLLPTFHGMESENPYSHIKEFEEVCNTFLEGGASIDLMRLKLFPFTLKDKAKAHEGESSQVREVKAVITLRSGKEVDLPTSKTEREPLSEAEKEKRGEIKGKRKENNTKNEDNEATVNEEL
ncbi:hypothetical protein VitviT2T_011693 [Vitis vinifera]|uniref:Uncharacterized protein n=1 Tax=Vitis vinifera TaxID=29760 RepID=A0ABY9CE15_VITVI|nr:hypothetical protein VitviT2T_011693 [Vitis vinifera]